MKVIKKGDIIEFTCKACGCFFIEAVNKTTLAYAGVHDPDHTENGTYMTCPCCGNERVLGFRPDTLRKKNEPSNEKEGVYKPRREVKS